jgi:hypothetical protein
MNALKIEAKYDTPKVTLDKQNSQFRITGRSIPEDASEFYQPILAWTTAYAAQPNDATVFTFELDYFNTASSRCLQNLMLALKEIPGIRIEWLFKEDDQDMEEAGADFSQLIEHPIDIRQA